MADKPCDNIRDMLVAFSDGELSVEDKAQVEEHVATCEACREELQALERSLELAGTIWQDQEAELAEIKPLNFGSKSRRWELRRAALAATILIALGGILIWQAISPQEKHVVSIPPIPEPTPAEIERAVNRAADAAILFASADIIANQPHGQTYAMERYEYLISNYAETEYAQKAKLRLNAYTERSVTP
jgi:putative zinc finger protein